MTLKQAYYSVMARVLMAKKDIRSGFPMSFVRKLSLWRRGFLSEKHVLYGFDKNPWKQFISDYHTAQARWINEPYCDILTNKYLFSKMMQPFIRTPKIFAVIFEGRIVSDGESIDITDFAGLASACRQMRALVIKPVTGGGGKGVSVLRWQDGTFLINRRPICEKELETLIIQMKHGIVTDFIEQAPYAKGLNPDSTNTLRVLTLIDPQRNTAFIARAVQRIGNKKSAPQDNFTRGGLSAIIDLETGVLGRAASHPTGMTLEWHERHPDTGNQITGIQIPQWAVIQQKIISAADRVPFLQCIGWDIVITEDGIVAIEGNHHPDPDVLQCHGPLLVDQRIRGFYRKHRIIA